MSDQKIFPYFDPCTYVSEKKKKKNMEILELSLYS